MRDDSDGDWLEVHQPQGKKTNKRKIKEPAVSDSRKGVGKTNMWSPNRPYTIKDYKTLCDFNEVNFEATVRPKFLNVNVAGYSLF